MNRAKQLELEFAQKAILRGGLLLLTSLQAVELVKRCRDENVNVLGIDSFRITDTTTQPVQEHSVDFSREGVIIGTDVWRRAEVFLLEREASNLLFEVVLDPGD